ncbi:hypothetical protein ZZ1p0003 [Acinetobacter phage ZZ1]|jgi:hypothetical protein|uniref:Uncharacterized protein n=3 Tax=Caudoviricetes TaxID=2731619 RepID=A0A410T5Z5_9CAUD|nr:hypothetical protein ZZ1p0003 [Acinetobacter phage ZZ1]AFL47639.1 hypothetical protein ZZ1p0003 [Acinetobacter phage ZZ1]QAU04046.1 hypothetical protein Henu6_gp65 [Acinetobacter phage Henu6]
MICPPVINKKNLAEAIKRQHHSTERFFDVHEAAIERNLNLEMAARLEAGVASEEDERKAIELLKRHGL